MALLYAGCFHCTCHVCILYYTAGTLLCDNMHGCDVIGFVKTVPIGITIEIYFMA